MTISYSDGIGKLILRWKGSLWKSVWKELLVFLLLYYAIYMIYELALNEGQRDTFEKTALIFNNYLNSLPLTFLLGFYITSIVRRWWAQFEWVAWPDDVISQCCTLIMGDDHESTMKRHNIARYLVLVAALCWRDISEKVQLRFPTLDHLVKAGLMTEEEKNSIKAGTDVGFDFLDHACWNFPIQWCQKIIVSHVQTLPAPNPFAPVLAHTLRYLNDYRQCFRMLYCYDWVCIPLVYTQVAALATYTFMGFCLIGRQFLDPKKELDGYEVRFYVPVLTIVQFLFYVGWFKVGQDLMRPFGTDDDDIELNYILDRHIHFAFTTVHYHSRPGPKLTCDDRFWEAYRQQNECSDRSKIPRLPHTRKSSTVADRPPKRHVSVKMGEKDAEILELGQLPGLNGISQMTNSGMSGVSGLNGLSYIDESEVWRPQTSSSATNSLDVPDVPVHPATNSFFSKIGAFFRRDRFHRESKEELRF